MKRIALSALLILGGCATSAQLAPVAYDFVDHPERRGVSVAYTNETNRTMCLLPEHWPNSAGRLDGDGAALIVAGQRFQIEDFNTGYCPGGCATKVRPGERVTSFIPYSYFRLPGDLVNAPKRLDFKPPAYPCA